MGCGRHRSRTNGLELVVLADGANSDGGDLLSCGSCGLDVACDAIETIHGG